MGRYQPTVSPYLQSPAHGHVWQHIALCQCCYLHTSGTQPWHHDRPGRHILPKIRDDQVLQIKTKCNVVYLVFFNSHTELCIFFELARFWFTLPILPDGPISTYCFTIFAFIQCIRLYSYWLHSCLPFLWEGTSPTTKINNNSYHWSTTAPQQPRSLDLMSWISPILQNTYF